MRGFPSPAEFSQQSRERQTPSDHLPSTFRQRSRPRLPAEGGQAAMRRWLRSQIDSDKIALRSLVPDSEGLRQVGEGGWKVDGSDSRTHPKRDRCEMMR